MSGTITVPNDLFTPIDGPEMLAFLAALDDEQDTAVKAALAAPVRMADLAWLFEPATWEELRAVLLPVVLPLFTEAFLVGAHLATQQRPASGQRAWDESQHPRDPAGSDEGGEFAGGGGGGGGGPKVASGDTLDAVLKDMGGHALEYASPDTRPDLYEKHPVSGYMVRNDEPKQTIIAVDGKPMIQDTVPAKSPGGMRMGGNEKPVGAPRPLTHLFRAVSEEDWQGIQKRGYMKSDERMNLGPEEGTVAAFSNPSFYLPGALYSDKPGEHPGRILRIQYHSEDGWTYSGGTPDSYVKTQARIPLGHIDLVSPPIVQVVTEGRDGNKRRTLEVRAAGKSHADAFAIMRGFRAPPISLQAAGLPLPQLPFDFDAVNRAAQETIANYCVTPETKVLTLDLQWVPAGDLREGDRLLGFDDINEWRRARKYRAAAITAYSRRKMPVFEIALSNGDRLRSTGEHAWLVTESGGGHGMGVRWIRTQDMTRSRAPKLYFPRYMRQWEPAEGYDAGYLAAAFDGEGHLTFSQTIRTGFSQKDNAMLARVKGLLSRYGFDWSEYANGNSGVHNLHLNGQDERVSADGRRRGGVQERMRFLGMFRPVRLLDVYQRLVSEGRGMRMSACDFATVESVEYVGVKEIAAITSSTGTYIANGYGAHNTDWWWSQFSESTQRSLRRIIMDAEANGLTMPEITDQVEALFGPERAMNIAVSETTNLLGQGAQETYRRAGFTEYEWRTVRDARVDDLCRARDGMRFPMTTLFERLHPGCRCIIGGTFVSADGVLATMRRFYEGPVVTIRTALGHELTVTPNHPIATPTGWLAAADLHEGGYVLSDRRWVEPAAVGEPRDVHGPARIEDVRDAALRTQGSTRAIVEGQSVDFHGDGRDGEVEVVRPQRPLRVGMQAASSDGVEQRLLVPVQGDPVLASQRAEDAFSVGLRSAARTGMGIGDLRVAFSVATTGPHERAGLGGISRGDTGLHESFGHGESGEHEALREFVDARSCDVGSDKISGSDSPHLAVLDEAARGECPPDDTLRYSGLTEDDIPRLAALVAADRIVELVWGSARCHVYNLETVSGWYTSAGIVTHNCWPVPAGAPTATGALYAGVGPFA